MADRHTAVGGDDADLARAQRRLSQETEPGREPAIASIEQARARIGQLQMNIATDPHAVARAHGGIDADLFEAATARPTV